MQVNQLHDLDLERLQFVGESLTLLRQETQGQVGYYPTGAVIRGSELLRFALRH